MSRFPRDSGGQPENTNALRHGGAAAVKAIQQNEPLTGPARDAELQVYETLETAGRYSLVRRTAARLQAACDIYWGAVSKAAEDGDLVRLDSYIARFGWLAGASLRAWAQVKEEEKDASNAMLADYEEIIGESE